MKKIYVKRLAVFFFLLLILGQSVCYADFDIAEFKKLKSPKTIFKKDNSKKLYETPIKDESQGVKIEETELDKSNFSMFEETDDVGVFSNPESGEATKIKEKGENVFSKFFKNKTKKNKKLKKTKKQFSEEITQEDIIEATDTSDEYTYIGDEDTVYIKEVEIYGNNLVDINYIKEQMYSKEGMAYNRSNVSNDLKKLYSTGFFTQNIRALPIKIDDNNIKLRIILEENSPVAGFNIVGNNSISTNEIMPILNKFKGLPQNILGLNEGINEIQELYSNKGYILARIDKVVDDPDGYINIKIDEGIIGDIIVDGNNKTRDFVVKRNIMLQPGSVYNENTMRSDILRLMGTQAFKDVQRELKKDDQTGLYDVYVALEEQRTGKISLGVGIDSSSGFFGSVGFGENNFRGLGQKLNLNLLAGTGILMNDSSVVSKANLQGEISFLEPMFKRENQQLAIRGFGRYYGSYQVPLAIEKRFGGEVVLSRKFIAFKNLSGSLGFGAESVSLSEGDEAKIKSMYNTSGIDWAKRKEELDDGLYIKITPSLVYDTRDSFVNARRGVLARLTFEENLAISGSSFGKLHGIIKSFSPVGKKSSIVLTARAGGKIHGSMPDFAGFALGGPYTLRGFNISEVGVGNGYMMGSAEYRLPIPFIDKLTSNSFINNLRLAGFVDAGTVFNKSIGTRVYNKPGYAISAGVGLRVFIPGLGPINLDYGIPLTATKGVNRSGGFFTFGMGEMF